MRKLLLVVLSWCLALLAGYLIGAKGESILSAVRCNKQLIDQHEKRLLRLEKKKNGLKPLKKSK